MKFLFQVSIKVITPLPILLPDSGDIESNAVPVRRRRDELEPDEEGCNLRDINLRGPRRTELSSNVPGHMAAILKVVEAKVRSKDVLNRQLLFQCS